MITRRNFMKTLGAGTICGAASILPGVSSEASREKITIGIIGAENTHTAKFGRLFNVEKKFPGIEVKYVWGEKDEFAKKAMQAGNIPNQVKNPKEMISKIDALIVDHRHPKYHLPAATPFIKEGIPTFIDKPFCYRAAEGKEFLELAKKTGTPVTSFSAQAYNTATFDIIHQIRSIKPIFQIVRTGKVDLNSKYGGVFFYGVHIVQPLMYMFGEDIERVRISRDGQYGNASLIFSNGLFVTLIFKRKASGWETYIETDKEMIELKPRIEESDPPVYYSTIVEMFRTGKEPRSHQSILNCVSVLEAMEKSAENEKWVEVEYLRVQ